MAQEWDIYPSQLKRSLRIQRPHAQRKQTIQRDGRILRKMRNNHRNHRGCKLSSSPLLQWDAPFCSSILLHEPLPHEGTLPNDQAPHQATHEALLEVASQAQNRCLNAEVLDRPSLSEAPSKASHGRSRTAHRGHIAKERQH